MEFDILFYIKLKKKNSRNEGKIVQAKNTGNFVKERNQE